MSIINDNLSGEFISNWNSRPLLLPYDEVKEMKDILNGGIGSLIICPVFTVSESIPEPIISLRYIFYKKNVQDVFEPKRFDFKPVQGSINSYLSYLNNTTYPNFEIPQTTEAPIPPIPPSAKKMSLAQMFTDFVNPTTTVGDGESEIDNKFNFFAIFLQKYVNGTYGLETVILTRKGGGGVEDGGPGGVIIASGNPPH